MVTRSQNSRDANPLSSRSLFLKTIEIFEDASEFDDFESRLGFVENSFKSRVSRSSNKLQELAKNIVNENSSYLSSSNLKSRVLIKKSSEAIHVAEEVNPLKQRQGLGSKRARFSMNPDSSQDAVNSEAALVVNDPEQFFEVYEQHENVKNGIKRQKRGVLSDSVLQNTSLTNQPRRTEIKELMDSRIFGREFQSLEEEDKEVVPAEAKIKFREQRPGLGQKRARFSIKPDSSQRVVNIEPTLDVKNLNDPEEFFKACELKENANKEIRRQIGGILPDSAAQTGSVINRPRRPGLLDHNKRISLYKHLYQSHDVETSSTVVPTQESTDSEIPNKECHDLGGARNCNIPLKGAESPGSVAVEVGKLNEILDQLLSSNEEELEGDRVIDVLRERLKIKPIELQKLNLPDFPDLPNIDLSPAASRKLRFSSVTHMYPKDGPESSIYNIASPSTLKSPFASFPSLTRQILRSSPSNDPFSADDIDSEPITSRSFEKLNKEFIDEAQKAVTESLMPEVETNTEIRRTSASKQNETLDEGSSVSHLPGPDDSEIITDDEFAGLIPSNDPISADNIGSGPIICRSFEQHNKEFADAAQNAVTESPLPEVENYSEIPRTSASKLHESLDMGSNASHLRGSDDSDINTDNDFAKDKLVCQTNEAAFNNEIHTGELHDSDVTAQPSLITEDVALNKDSEERIEVTQEQSNTTLDKKGKVKSPSRKAERRRKTQRRQSLAVPGIGTTWDDGVRRSTRIRVRPLEHWKGERLLFGRIHNSLPTVIGLKYIPQGESSGNPVLQVKSYVGDEYKELVDVAALH